MRIVSRGLAPGARGCRGCSCGSRHRVLAATDGQAPEGVTDRQIVVGMSAPFKGASRSLGIELYRGSMAYLSPRSTAPAACTAARSCSRPTTTGISPIRRSRTP